MIRNLANDLFEVLHKVIGSPAVWNAYTIGQQNAEGKEVVSVYLLPVERDLACMICRDFYEAQKIIGKGASFEPQIWFTPIEGDGVHVAILDNASDGVYVFQVPFKGLFHNSILKTLKVVNEDALQKLPKLLKGNDMRKVQASSNTYKVRFTFNKDGKEHKGTCEIEAPSKDAAEDSAYAVLHMRKFEKVNVLEVTEATKSVAVKPFQSQSTNPTGKYYVGKDSVVFFDRQEWEEAANASGLDVEDGPAIGRQLCAFRGNKIVGIFTYKSNLNEGPFGYIHKKEVK
jgi:hypothetical protein